MKYIRIYSVMIKARIGLILLVFTLIGCSCSSDVKIKNLGVVTTIEKLESEGVIVHKLLKYPTSEEFVAILPNGVVINEGGILTETGHILETTRTGLSDQHRLIKMVFQKILSDPIILTVDWFSFHRQDLKLVSLASSGIAAPYHFI